MKIYITTHWSNTIFVKVKYVHRLLTPIAKVQLQCRMVTPTATNHDLTKFYYPKLNSLTVGADVIILKNKYVYTLIINDTIVFF